jgi:hypothetical protein
MTLAGSTAERKRDSWTLDYRLSHCEGYSVSSPDRHVGYVEEVVPSPDEGEPVALKVRTGYGCTRGVVLLPIDCVHEVLPSREHIVVEDASPLPDGRERRTVMTDTKTQRAKRGDWLVVHGHAVGEPERTGEILEVLGEPGHEHYRVRWDEEHESLVYPSSDVSIRRKGARR